MPSCAFQLRFTIYIYLLMQTIGSYNHIVLSGCVTLQYLFAKYKLAKQAVCLQWANRISSSKRYINVQKIYMKVSCQLLNYICPSRTVSLIPARLFYQKQIKQHVCLCLLDESAHKSTNLHSLLGSHIKGSVCDWFTLLKYLFKLLCEFHTYNNPCGYYNFTYITCVNIAHTLCPQRQGQL